MTTSPAEGEQAIDKALRALEFFHTYHENTCFKVKSAENDCSCCRNEAYKAIEALWLYRNSHPVASTTSLTLALATRVAEAAIGEAAKLFEPLPLQSGQTRTRGGATVSQRIRQLSAFAIAERAMQAQALERSEA